MSDELTNEFTNDNASTQADKDLLQLVSFVVGAEEYAIPILAVQEINRMMDITRVPQSPAFVEGVINLRGKVIPVVDLRKRFGMPVNESTGEERIIVVEVQGDAEARVIGFTVDKVNRVLRIGSDIVSPNHGQRRGQRVRLGRRQTRRGPAHTALTRQAVQPARTRTRHHGCRQQRPYCFSGSVIHTQVPILQTEARCPQPSP